MDIISRIKEKKELSGVSDVFVQKILEDYLKSNRLSIPSNEKSLKILIKEIRKRLRRYAGQYVSGKSEVIETHVSTKERKEIYPFLKEEIEKRKAKSILDLGCGINPIFLANKNLTYYACDINSTDLDRVKAFFEDNKIKGRVYYADIFSEPFFPKADICLIFKVLDLADKNKYEKVEELLKKLDCQTIIVSFPTKKISGVKMNMPERRWFERILKRLNYAYEIKKTENELFYFIEKQ